MKILKITTLVLIAGFMALAGYANFRVRSEGEKQKHVELTSFQLTGHLDAAALSALEKNIKATDGVRACAINAKSETACVIYYKDVISESRLASMLTSNSIREVSKKDLAASGGGCPIHKAGASFDQLISALDVRTQ
jgi:hypothetical protein